MSWPIEYTDEFGEWWETLTEDAQDDIDVAVRLLEEHGPNLAFPFSSGINGSRYAHMRELRVQHKGYPLRILYAFDPRRTAILLIGGCKSGSDRWYERYIPIADKLYAEHLKTLKADKAKEK